MSFSFSNRIYAPLAVGVLLVGLLGLGHGMRRIADARAGCATLRAHQSRLEALAAQLSAFVQARDTLVAQAAGASPAKVDSLLSAAFPGSTPVVRQTTRQASAGWQLRAVDVSLRNVSVARIFRFVETAEAHAIPLRLVRCEFRSLPGAAGHVDASLEFNRVEPIENP
jgi:hypothetical protein